MILNRGRVRQGPSHKEILGAACLRFFRPARRRKGADFSSFSSLTIQIAREILEAAVHSDGGDGTPAPEFLRQLQSGHYVQS